MHSFWLFFLSNTLHYAFILAFSSIKQSGYSQSVFAAYSLIIIPLLMIRITRYCLFFSKNFHHKKGRLEQIILNGRIISRSQESKIPHNFLPDKPGQKLLIHPPDGYKYKFHSHLSTRYGIRQLIFIQYLDLVF